MGRHRFNANPNPYLSEHQHENSAPDSATEQIFNVFDLGMLHISFWYWTVPSNGTKPPTKDAPSPLL